MPLITKPGVAETSRPLVAGDNSSKPGILVCVDRSRHARRVLACAGVLAGATGSRLVMMRVLDPHSGNDLPPDPVDWEVRRREAGSALARLAERECVEAEVVLNEGRPAEEIRHEAERRGAEFIVLGRCGEEVEDMARAAGLGPTARAVLEHAQDKVLLVPEGGPRAPEYRRILVPLDGSCWAESALPTALRLARATGAEIVLAQVVIMPDLVGPTPPEPEDAALRDRMLDRNRRAASAYLERQRAILTEQGIAVHARVLPAADARSVLLRLMQEGAFDLVVLSARGSGYRHLPGTHFGSVAAHLSLHSGTPLLIVRPDTHNAQRRSEPAPLATARPATAMPDAAMPDAAMPA